MEIEIYYFDRKYVRQRILLFKAHNFLALYNHSGFIRMHVHNAWFMQLSKLVIILPELLFETPDHLFIFCGTFQLQGLCDSFEMNKFSFEKFMFAASCLMRNF